MKVHPVFHVSLLTPYQANTLPGRVQPPPPPIIVEGFEEFEVQEILDSRIHYNKLQYFVDWKNYGPHERTWEPAKFLNHAKEAVARFHTRHPNRPSPKDISPGARGVALSLSTILPIANITPAGSRGARPLEGDVLSWMHGVGYRATRDTGYRV